METSLFKRKPYLENDVTVFWQHKIFDISYAIWIVPSPAQLKFASGFYKPLLVQCDIRKMLSIANSSVTFSLDTWAAVVADSLLAVALGTRRSLKSRVWQRLGLLTHTWWKTVIKRNWPYSSNCLLISESKGYCPTQIYCTKSKARKGLPKDPYLTTSFGERGHWADFCSSYEWAAVFGN